MFCDPNADTSSEGFMVIMWMIQHYKKLPVIIQGTWIMPGAGAASWDCLNCKGEARAGWYIETSGLHIYIYIYGSLMVLKF